MSDYESLVGEMRELLDAFARAEPSADQIERLRGHVGEARQIAEDAFAPVEERRYGALPKTVAGRPHLVLPEIRVASVSERELIATIEYSDFFVGRLSVHGGAVGLVFDEMLGWLSYSSGAQFSRTAYLHVNYRSLTPLNYPLDLRCWVDRVEGRKRFIVGELYAGDTLCADAEGLFIDVPSSR